MPIVADKATGSATPTDKSYKTYNRSMAGTPNAVLTPEYVGEIVLDTTNKVRWKARSLLNSGWTPLEAEVT